WTTESRICEMKSITLPSTHYAAQWKTEGIIKSLPEISDLGRRYAELPAEIDGKSNPAKQDLLLELCQCFHPYLMKYLVMICRSEEHTSELQSLTNLVCRLLLEKKKTTTEA